MTLWTGFVRQPIKDYFFSSRMGKCLALSYLKYYYKNPTRHRATKPAWHSYWARMLWSLHAATREKLNQREACMPQGKIPHGNASKEINLFLKEGRLWSCSILFPCQTVAFEQCPHPSLLGLLLTVGVKIQSKSDLGFFCALTFPGRRAYWKWAEREHFN